MTVTTHYRRPDRWTRAAGVAVRGRAFCGDDLLAGEDLRAHLADADSLEAFAAALDDLNGSFAAVVEREGRTFLGVDHVRSVPLFYAAEGGDEPAVSDDARWLRAHLGDPPNDPLAESELLVSGTVFGNRTLVPGTYSVRPGEAVALGDEGVETARYFTYHPREDAAVGDPDTVSRLDAAVDRAADRLSRVVGDRQVCLSLSGGYDSRLVATLLAERDHDVLAYSFGRPAYGDVTVAREVADALGIDWEFVEYSTDRWRAWYESDARATALDHLFSLDSIPNYGTLPALAELDERGLLDDDAVCCSGQTVAGMAESVPHQLDRPNPTFDDIVDALVAYESRWRYDDPAFDRAFREGIRSRLPVDAVDSLPAAFAAYESVKWAERQCKYFVAEVRQYDHLGRDWWLPLWDRDVVDAWAAVPFAERRGKAAYRTVVDRRYAAAAGIDPREAAALGVETTPPSPVGRAVEWVAERVVDTPLAPWLAGLYWRLQRSDSAYDDHPLGWYGIVPRAVFERCYTGREDVHAFQTLAAGGRADFAEGWVTDPPRDGVVSLPYRGGSDDPEDG